MSPLGLINLIREFNYYQWKWIEEIGFGGCYYLIIETLPLKLCHWLVENFDPLCCTLCVDNHKKLKVNEDDVHAIFGLSKGLKVVVEAKNNNDGDDFKKILSSWISHWGIKKGCVKTNDMSKKILGETCGRDDFKRDFIVYVVSVCLKGSANVNFKYKVLKS